MEAIQKLEDIQYYLEVTQKAPEAALAMVRRIILRVPKILNTPLSVHTVVDYDDNQVRQVHENPYRIIYYVTEEVIYILSIMHHRQLIPNYKKILAGVKEVTAD